MMIHFSPINPRNQQVVIKYHMMIGANSYPTSKTWQRNVSLSPKTDKKWHPPPSRPHSLIKIECSTISKEILHPPLFPRAPALFGIGTICGEALCIPFLIQCDISACAIGIIAEDGVGWNMSLGTYGLVTTAHRPGSSLF